MQYVLKRRIHLNESSVKFNKTYCLKANEKSYVLVVNPDNQTSDETVYYTFTINPTPENAVVTINGEVTNSVTLVEGSNVEWSVYLDGYSTQSGSLVLSENTTVDVVLEETKYYTLTINASNEHNNSTPVVVTINGEVTNSITVVEGTEITYRVECTGYQSKYGTLTLTEDTVLNIVLIGNP